MARLGVIEVTFRQSFGGSLRLLIREAKAKKVDLPFAWEDIFCCCIDLQRGPITVDLLATRRKWIESASHLDGEDRVFYLEQIEKTRTAVETLRQRFKRGEPARLWISSTPTDLCGACWILSLLAPYGGQILLCFFPQPEAWDSEASACWSACPTEKILSYLSLQKELPQAAQHMAAQYWQTLCRENAPLRALVNGMLVSVPEDFYDPFLRRLLENIPQQELLLSHIVGQALMSPGLNHLGDSLILSRLEALRETGEIDITTLPSGRPWLRKR